jgi:hypothetical protein
MKCHHVEYDCNCVACGEPRELSFDVYQLRKDVRALLYERDEWKRCCDENARKIASLAQERDPWAPAGPR